MLFMGSKCQSPDAIVLAEGPKTTLLGQTKDEQIKGLKQQVLDEQAARALEQALAAKASSNFLGVLKALEYTDQSPGRDAATEESKLGIQRLGKDDPAETVKALQRVIDVVTGQRDKAMKDYATARGETEAERVKVAAKDKELSERDAIIKNRDGQIAMLETEKKVEQDAHKADVEKALALKNAEIQRVKDEFASKERATWVLWTRIAGLLFIVGGAVIAIVFKIVPEGAAFVGVGVAIGLVSIFIDWITQQWWFGWACGGTILIIVSVGGYALWRMYKKNTLLTKVTAVIQDIKDESATLKNDLAAKVDEHMDYRLGDKGKAELTKLSASLNLTNPKADVAISTVNLTPPQS